MRDVDYMAEKHKLHNVRLDDEVWAAIKEMDCSLNQYLRSMLLRVSEEPRPMPSAEREPHTTYVVPRGLRAKGDAKR